MRGPSEPLLTRRRTWHRTCVPAPALGFPHSLGSVSVFRGVELGPTAPGSARWGPWWPPGLDLGLWVSRGRFCSPRQPRPHGECAQCGNPAEVSAWAAAGGGDAGPCRWPEPHSQGRRPHCPWARRTAEAQKPASSPAFTASAALPRQPVCGRSAPGVGGLCTGQTAGCWEWAVQPPYPSVVQTWVLPLSRPSGLLASPPHTHPNKGHVMEKLVGAGTGSHWVGARPKAGRHRQEACPRGGQTQGAAGGASPARDGEWTPMFQNTRSLCPGAVCWEPGWTGLAGVLGG